MKEILLFKCNNNNEPEYTFKCEAELSSDTEPYRLIIKERFGCDPDWIKPVLHGNVWEVRYIL